MWIHLDADHPVGDLDELVPGHPKVLLVQEEHGPLEVGSSKQHVVEGQEAVERDPLGIFSFELLGNPLDHLLLPLLSKRNKIANKATT